MANNLALFGGTFDPIHNGHLKVAQIVIDQLNFNQIIFIPNNIQPHRYLSQANSQDRLAMLKLAIENTNSTKFIVNTCELDRAGPSYTIDTVEYISHINPCNIWLILGLDSFYSLPSWHNFEKLLKSCNFIVLNRAINNAVKDNNNSENLMQESWAINYLKKNTIALDDLHNLNNTNNNNKYKQGSVIVLDNDLINISGSNIRALLHNYRENNFTNEEIKNQLLNSFPNILPDQVLNYILEHKLYI